MTLTAVVTLPVPNTDEELTFSVTGRCTARGHRGFFDHISGAAEPPSGDEFEDGDWSVEWPAGSDSWHDAPSWMVEVVMRDQANADRLQEAFEKALVEHDEDERLSYGDYKYDLERDRRFGC